MVFEPYRGDIVGYIAFFHAHGQNAGFSDTRAFREAVGLGLYGPSSSIVLGEWSSDGTPLIRDGSRYRTPAGIEIPDLEAVLEQPWVLVEPDVGRLRELQAQRS